MPLPIDYWPSNQHVTLNYSAQYLVNGVFTRSRIYKITPQVDRTFNNMVTHVLLHEFLHEPVGKAAYYSRQYTYYTINETSITNVAYQWADDPPEAEETPSPDLKAPIIKGTAWTCLTKDTVLSDQLKDPVPMSYTLSIDATALTVSTPAGEFKGCVRVKQVGLSSGEVTIRCKDGSTNICKIYVERYKYWCPGLGGIKELSETHYASASNRDNICLTTNWSSEVVEIIHHQ